MKRSTMTRMTIFLLIGAGMICMFALAPRISAGQTQKSQIASSDKPADGGTAVPEAVFPQKQYEFAPVMDGVEVKHDFIVENHGKAPLIIQNVRPG